MPAHAATLRWPATLACALALVAGCSTPGPPDASAPTSGPAATRATFEAAPCPTSPEPLPALATASCGYLLVPEDRSDAGSRTIRLAVATIPAASPDPAPDPIVFLAGGPGSSALADAEVLVDAGLHHDRDLVVMDQRGTLHSEPALLCPELDAFNARAVGLVHDAPATGRERTAAVQACHRRLVGEGIDLGSYNTTQNAADVADLRTALGIDEWNVYGYSYGTDLALTYLRDHPEGIRTLTIDSVVPPPVLSLGWTWSSAQEGFGNLFAACDAQPACRDRYPDLGARFTELVQRLEAQPLAAEANVPGTGQPVTVVVDGGTLVNLLVGSLRPFADVPAALDALHRGDAGAVVAARAAAAAPMPSDFAHGLTYSVFCAEMVPHSPPGDLLAKGREAFPDWPDAVLAQAPQLPFEAEGCAVWDVPPAPASQRAPTTSSVPALVVSGTFDAKTGARWGAHAARDLSSATVVEVPGVGHWAIPQSPCAQEVMRSFLHDPARPDTACVAALAVPAFTVG